MTERLGVGILGAGPVTQAIHLPTLARQADRYRVVSVMDVDPETAKSVAARADAGSATTIEAVLAHPDVDVVAVCSPHQFHAQQVEAICAAGKRGILCEKPLAVDRNDAEGIATAVRAAGVPLVVGAMHAYDPGWLAAVEACGDRLDQAHTLRSTIVLPFNDRY
jgi:myo-inositol 2-dehydrogenase/D-chiro-inositol 1-dehydrogenase